MRILMIAPTPFFADRGCHTQIYEEIKALQKLGHEVVLCTYGLGRDMDGVKTVRTINFPWYNKLAAGPSKTKFLLLPFLTLTVLRTALSFKPDVIHGHLHEGACIAKVCSFFFPKKKFVFDMQGSLTGELMQHGFVKKNSLVYGFFAFIERKIANWFHVITQSTTMLLELDGFGVPRHRRTNVFDGVDTDEFRELPFDEELGASLNISKDRPRVLFMGLLETYQGADLMLEAFKKVKEIRPDIQFIIIGYPNIEKYQELAKKLGVLENCRFLGRIDYKKLPHYLSLSSIGIAPKIAKTEGDGKIYNYMAMAMLTIAFDRSVSREILGETGIFAKFGNPDDLAAKIDWALTHPAESAELGQAARHRAVERLSWLAVGKRISAVYSMV